VLQIFILSQKYWDKMALNVLRDTIESIVGKFKVKGKVVTLPGRGRKRKSSTAATRFLRSQAQKNP